MINNLKKIPKGLFFQKIPTIIGKIGVLASNEKLFALTFQENFLLDKLKEISATEKKTTFIQEVQKQLDSYFSQKTQKFNIPTEIIGTPFQKKVLQELIKIPYGTVVSYKELALKSGKTAQYSRAIGSVMRSNPIPIIYPCHRVVGTNGSLTGFGGGLDLKSRLLNLEQNKV